MKITVRKTQAGQWLVHEAKPHTLGIGVKKVGTPTAGYTTGAQYGKFATEVEARDLMQRLATERNFEIVEWVEPIERNTQYMDLPDNGNIVINADKTIEWYGGHVLKHLDVTPYPEFGYSFALTDTTTGQRFLESSSPTYSAMVLKQVIREFREAVDNHGGKTFGV